MHEQKIDSLTTFDLEPIEKNMQVQDWVNPSRQIANKYRLNLPRSIRMVMKTSYETTKLINKQGKIN